ncbi:MAG: 3-deoxy-D-manno-octulosonic acid transferase, partial [Burkholderiales bacterium]
MTRLLYRALVWLALPGVMLRLAWRARRQPEYLKNLSERFGYSRAGGGGRPIWIHAVSVGETRAAEPLIRAIEVRHPNVPILLTCTTPTGRATGEQLYGTRVTQAYLPYDLPHAVRRFLRTHQPKLGILLETELWPELILGCQEQAIPLSIVNARLSRRSARRYGHVSSFTAQVLNATTVIAAQSQADMQRFQALGAARVVTCGNLKFDRSAQPGDYVLASKLRRYAGDRPIVLVASTRQGEENLFLEAWRDTLRRDVLMVLVPRHPQRFDEVEKLIENHGLRLQRRSHNETVHAQTQV